MTRRVSDVSVHSESNTHAVYRVRQHGPSFVRHFFCSAFNCSRLCRHIRLPLHTHQDICMTNRSGLSALPCYNADKVMGGQRHNCNASTFSSSRCFSIVRSRSLVVTPVRPWRSFHVALVVPSRSRSFVSVIVFVVVVIVVVVVVGETRSVPCQASRWEVSNTKRFGRGHFLDFRDTPPATGALPLT